MVLIDKDTGRMTMIQDTEIIGVKIDTVETTQPKTHPLYVLTMYTTGGHALVQQGISKEGIETLIKAWTNDKSWSLPI